MTATETKRNKEKTVHSAQQSMMKITDCLSFIHLFNYPKDLSITTFGYRPSVKRYCH